MCTVNSALISQYLRKSILSVKRSTSMRMGYMISVGSDGSTRYTVAIARR